MNIILASTKILQILANSQTNIVQRWELNNLFGRANEKEYVWIYTPSDVVYLLRKNLVQIFFFFCFAYVFFFVFFFNVPQLFSMLIIHFQLLIAFSTIHQFNFQIIFTRKRVGIPYNTRFIRTMSISTRCRKVCTQLGVF